MSTITAWDNDRRRSSGYVALGMATSLALLGVAAWFFGEATPVWVYWTFAGLLALVLVFVVLLLVMRPRAAVAAAPAADAAPAEEAAQATAPAAAPAYEPRVLTLRCGDCSTIFEVTDTGERPLYHTCPGCGAEGALRDELAAAPPTAEAPAPEAAYAPPPAAYAPPYPDAIQTEAPAEPAPAAPAVKKLKLRCGGCKEVFSIEDTGERPLKRACPHCGRVGKIG